MAFWDKAKQAGSLLVESAGDLYDESKEAATGAYEGAKARLNGATIITEGVKEVHLTENDIYTLYSCINSDEPNENAEIIIDDTATDDGYNKVRITIVKPVNYTAEGC